LPTTNHRPPTTDHRPPTTDHRPPTTDHRPLAASRLALPTEFAAARTHTLRLIATSDQHQWWAPLLWDAAAGRR
jgi:hypothetical protein